MEAVVALGKFDALHRGHRLLAEQAASMHGAPWLISFSGMAQELGWQVRLPLVAPSERTAVLHSWAPFCHGRAPRMRCVPFGAVRQLSPRDFVATLAEDLKAAGVVVGVNYRFGFKAAGTATTLQELGAEYGMRVRVMDLLGDSADADGNVSSSEVRQALVQGRLDLVEGWLGRPYSVIAHQPSTATAPSGQQTLQVLQQSFENQPPGQGTYEAELTSAAVRRQQAGHEICRVAVEMTVMGQALLRPLDNGWPPWMTETRKLRLTF